MKIALVLIVILFACGCMSDRYEGSLHGVRYHDDAEVVLSELVEAVRPVAMPDTEMKALILPFAVSQDMAVRRDVARELTDILRLSWLERRVFDVFEYEGAQAWQGLDHAMALARSKGANVLVSGNLSQYYEGGRSGRTSIGLTIEVRWVPDNTLIWSAAQAAVMEGGLDKDYVIVRTTRRLPDNPVYAVMRALSASMAEGYVRHRQF